MHIYGCNQLHGKYSGSDLTCDLCVLLLHACAVVTTSSFSGRSTDSCEDKVLAQLAERVARCILAAALLADIEWVGDY